MTVHRYSILTYRTKGANANVVYTFTNPDRLPNPRWNFGGGTTQAQGSTSGYTSGGAAGGSSVNTIDKFPFASDANATDVGDLTQGRYWTTGQSSTASGYTSGGFPGPTNVIDKFPFASNANATDVGDITQARHFLSGHSSTASGYASGGATAFPGTPTVNTIDKFPFASNANATDVGDLLTIKTSAAGQSSSSDGYSSGGGVPPLTPSTSNVIEKFPFASDANASDVGDLSQARTSSSGQNSATDGYTSGGISTEPATVNTIDKFPFASNANATDVGDLTTLRNLICGQSSTASGYTTGGPGPFISPTNVIDKFPFASNANATDVGDLSQARIYRPAGQQV